MHPQLIVEQKITAFVNQYAIYAAAADGSKAQLQAFAQQKRLNIKEKIIFYSDTSRSTELFSFRAEKVMDVHGRYFVEDASGVQIGAFRKDFGASLLRSTWQILAPDYTVLYTITESNATLAALRRFVGWIPFVGDIFDIILGFIRYHFVLLDASGTQRGVYTKTTLFRDHYQLATDPELQASVDWRVLASMGVALDALQSR